MDNLYNIFDSIINQDLIEIVISNPRIKDNIKKIKIRPIILKDNLLFQVTEYIREQVFHKNCTKEEILNNISNWFDVFKQAQISSKQKQVTILISKNKRATVKEKAVDLNDKIINLNHNRKKEYILEEGRPLEFLIDLGVMSKEGNIIKSKYDKFKQINRYLEFIQDILPNLDSDKELTIIDFGCGKSYLTFAMYYYLKYIAKRNIRVIGLDLKEDVINQCNKLKDKYGFCSLHFEKGNIESFNQLNEVDMVVTLHACDVATDYALAKAVKWGAKVILCVPCCQHELNNQIKSNELESVLKYGLIKERIAALVTDALRAELLEKKGYKTQILEFVDMEHTPKNILIRAVRTNNIILDSDDYDLCVKSLNLHPKLEELLK